MKLIFFVTFLAFALASCEEIDWSAVKPLHEIKEWQEAHPNFDIDAIRRMHPSRPSRILNGEIAGATSYPYAAGVMLHFDSANSFCGGSLISRNFVLTAANCVHLVPSSSVLLGASNMWSVSYNVRTTRMTIHPQYSFDDSLNDIATLELGQPADLGEFVGLVRLPNRRQNDMTFENQEGIILGWGRTSSTGNEPIPTQFLRALRAPITTNLSCLIRYPAFITGSNVCTNPNQGTPCDGDQGGPLMILEADGQRTQVGVFSYQFSLGCGLGWPAVYARVTSFLNFIEQNSDVRILETWE